MKHNQYYQNWLREPISEGANLRNIEATINSVRNTPTCFTDRHLGKCHESLLRSFQILAFAKDWLEDGVPGHVVLDAINMLQNLPPPSEAES